MVLIMKQNFIKNKVVTGKTLCDRSLLFVQTLASDRAVLYGNVVFSFLELSIEKNYSRSLFFKKFVSKLKHEKRSKFPEIVL